MKKNCNRKRRPIEDILIKKEENRSDQRFSKGVETCLVSEWYQNDFKKAQNDFKKVQIEHKRQSK